MSVVLLVSGGTGTTSRLAGHPNLGVLLVPRAGNALPPVGTLWACDNGAFKRFDDVAFRNMLKRIEKRRDCLWVAAPDVVGDAEATAERWEKWAPIIKDHGQQPAFVCQDGLVAESVPWMELGAVFIGGTTRFKLGHEAARIVDEARIRNVWAHMGRVNSYKRILYAAVIGCNSVDGTQYSKWGDVHLPPTLAFLSGLSRQRSLRNVLKASSDPSGTPEG